MTVTVLATRTAAFEEDKTVAVMTPHDPVTAKTNDFCVPVVASVVGFTTIEGRASGDYVNCGKETGNRADSISMTAPKRGKNKKQKTKNKKQKTKNKKQIPKLHHDWVLLRHASKTLTQQTTDDIISCTYDKHSPQRPCWREHQTNLSAQKKCCRCQG